MTAVIEQMTRANNAAKQGARTDLATFSSTEEKVAKPDRSTWTNDVVADAIGMSRASYERTKDVVETSRNQAVPAPI